ncbi:MAG: hypothetical protein AAB619_00540 [Patescibacteria group bacterium]
MSAPTNTTTSTKTKHSVAIYLILAIGLIVGTVAAVAYLFTGK